MNLHFFKDIENNLRDTSSKDFVNNFIEELTDHLNNFKEEVGNKRSGKEKILREEDCIYQVVDLSLNGVYLQNTNNNVIFEEVNIPEELKSIISNDYILRYKNGTYVFEEELTNDFFENMIDINKYKEIQEKFIKKSNILNIDLDARFNVLSRGKDFTILKYKKGEMEVPNVLLPYFINEQSVLYYKNGKFHKDLSNLK